MTRRQGVRMDLDLSEFHAFVARAPVAVTVAAMAWYQEAGQELRARIVRQGTERFGVEMTESRMQTYDPSRPTGQYTGRVRARVTQEELRVGPEGIPYDWWIEKGSEAPPGTIPATHRDAMFRGHKPVTRATEEARETLHQQATKHLQNALDNATGGP